VDVPHDVAVPSDDKKRGFKQSVKVTIEDKEGQKHTLRLPLPYRPKGEMFAVAETFEDGKRRMGRIPGKMRRRMWVRENDLLIIVPWSFQDSKADVKFRYTATQSANLKRQDLIPEILDIY
jgi:translation initiation factor 1A